MTDNVQTEVGVEGSTYDPSPTDQPTNRYQPTLGEYIHSDDIPTYYISLRVTTPHTNVDAVLSLISDYEWYICYSHSGKDGNNEHFHVLVPGSTAADRERLRKRVKTAGYSGNKLVSVKLCENSVTSGITYCAKEGSKPWTKGSNVESWIRQSPEWVERRVGQKRKACDDYVYINVTNVMKLAFEFRNQEKLHTTSLMTVCEIMLNSGTYMWSPTMMRQGAPDWMMECFRESCETGTLRYSPKFWGPSIFRSMVNRF